MATLFSTDKALSYARKAEKARDWATAYDLLEGVLRRFPKNRRAKQMLKDMRPTAVQDILQQAFPLFNIQAGQIAVDYDLIYFENGMLCVD